MSSEEIVVVGLGVVLILIGLMVEVEHKLIWKNYKKNYHKHDNQLLETLLKPNLWVYRLNVYVVWPLIIALGLWIIVQNA